MRRLAYVTGALQAWADATTALTDPAFGIGRRLLLDHLEQLMCDLRCAVRPPAGDVRRMMPTAEGILKAHAPGLLIYGWCCGPGVFVAAAGALEIETKTDKRLNDRKRDEVAQFIKRHGLEATVLRGELYELFPSNC